MEQKTVQAPDLVAQAFRALISNTYTRNDALRRLRLLTEIINSLLFKHAGAFDMKAVFASVRAEREKQSNHYKFEPDMVFFESLPEEFYRLFSPATAPEIIDSIERQIENSKIVLMYVPFEMPDNEVGRIGGWFKQNLGATALFDLVFDPSLVAGCAMSLNGIYKDYSMKERLKQNRNLILDELNQLKKAYSMNNPVSNPAPAIEIGYSVSITNYLIWVNGLPDVKINEVVMTEEKGRGVVVSIEEDLVGVLMLDDVKIKPQQSFTRTGTQMSIATGNSLLGRTINPLGQPIDGKGLLSSLKDKSILDQSPTSIKSRELITRQLETGMALIDMLVPIAYGQRELVMGDAHSGKTGFLIDTVVNQKDKNMVCVYCLIGKPVREVKSIVEVLKGTNSLAYTVVVATSSSDKASLIYLTPQVGITIAEYFQKQGKDVLLILDDMGIHAKFYREISLLSGKPPGRDSYPGDIFYHHAKIIERAGSFNKEYGGGSITAIPVIETSLDDFSSYMTTNLMAMTDGHLLFSANRYHQGYRPSIDVSLSVSRVGRQTQNFVQKSLSDKVKALLSESQRLEAFSRLGSEISPQTQLILKQGKQIESISKQLALERFPIITQMILYGLVFTPFLASKDENFVETNKEKIIAFLGQKLDPKKYGEMVLKLTDDKEFVKNLESLGTELEAVCK